MDREHERRLQEERPKGSRFRENRCTGRKGKGTEVDHLAVERTTGSRWLKEGCCRQRLVVVAVAAVRVGRRRQLQLDGAFPVTYAI